MGAAVTLPQAAVLRLNTIALHTESKHNTSTCSKVTLRRKQRLTSDRSSHTPDEARAWGHGRVGLNAAGARRLQPSREGRAAGTALTPVQRTNRSPASSTEAPEAAFQWRRRRSYSLASVPARAPRVPTRRDPRLSLTLTDCRALDPAGKRPLEHTPGARPLVPERLRGQDSDAPATHGAETRERSPWLLFLT